MKSKSDPWTYDELFKYLKSPQSYVPGTKMSFAGLPREQDRINLIAYLRSNADSPAPIPAPAPKTAAPAAGTRCRRRQRRHAAARLPPDRGWCGPGRCRQRRSRAADTGAAATRPRRPPRIRQQRHAEKIRAQAGKAESPFHAAAGLGRPGQKRIARTRL